MLFNIIKVFSNIIKILGDSFLKCVVLTGVSIFKCHQQQIRCFVILPLKCDFNNGCNLVT